MKLRPKKMMDLSQQTIYQNFINEQLQSSSKKNDKLQNVQSKLTDYTIYGLQNKTKYPELLAKFINNINKTKHKQQKKFTEPTKIQPSQTQDRNKSKKFRKPSQSNSIYEQKKIQSQRISSHYTQLMKKRKMQMKQQRIQLKENQQKIPEMSFDYQKVQQPLSSEYNLNNYLTINPFNQPEYSIFRPNQFINLHSQFINPWYSINPFFKPNLQNFHYIPEDMVNGIYRQFKIYEQFKEPQINEPDKSKEPLIHKSEKIKEEEIKKIARPRISPVKIFKRASYHIGIAYSIYMDKIQKEGKQIHNFSDIDPTRHAKKYKTSFKKY